MESKGLDIQIILASNSPRRKELLKEIFNKVEYLPQNVDEKSSETNPQKLVLELCEKKINNLDLEYPNALIISADTIVSYNNIVYGKPKDEQDAFRILKELSGKMHYVYTGVCIAYKGKKTVFYDESKVIFKNLSDSEIVRYIKEKCPLDKAGAYGIQDNNVVDHYDGSYTNIMGLPMEKLKEKLLELEVI